MKLRALVQPENFLVWRIPLALGKIAGRRRIRVAASDPFELEIAEGRLVNMHMPLDQLANMSIDETRVLCQEDEIRAGMPARLERRHEIRLS